MESNSRGSIFGATIFFIIQNMEKYKATFKFLEDRDASVLVASSLTDVFNLIQSNKPEVIIAEEVIEDIKQGEEILRKLNLIMQNRSKLILIGDSTPEDKPDDISYITKPFTTEFIYEVIYNLIQRKFIEDESLLKLFTGFDFNILIIQNGQNIDSELIDISESSISFEIKTSIKSNDRIDLLVSFISHDSEQKIKISAVMTNSKEIEQGVYLVQFNIDHQSKDEWVAIYREIIRIQTQATNFIKVVQN